MTKPNKNVFDLSHDVKLSCNMGELIPTMIIDCVPGDKFNIGCDSLIRFAPMVAPVMHRMDCYMHYFFVPNRLIWPGWEEYITNQDDAPGFPTMNIQTGATYTRLCDYLGLPTPIGAEQEVVSALPFAAYQLIWNEYYRDQNLSTQIDALLEDGDNSAAIDFFILRNRCWEHDYFTSALPFAQKGAGVDIPLAGFQDVPVLRDKPVIVTASVFDDISVAADDLTISNAVSANTDIPDGSLYADTSNLTASSTTINDLRRAFRLQEWLEKAARGGSRYVESILSHFGVKSPDARLNRPEYITGTKSAVIISEVLNTSDTVDAPQGNMAGHGVAVSAGKYGNYYVQEHGYIMGIMSIMPKTAYQQGIPKHFLKTTDPFEFYWPSFAHIGEQEVLNKEVYAFQGSTGSEVFGYVPRYAEYKFQNNRVAGDFKTTLDHWHLARKFPGAPALNEEFVEADPTHRIFAVIDPDVQKLYAHILHKVRAVRSMPKFGTPTF